MEQLHYFSQEFLVENKFRIGIISGKLGGVDGVSLEVDKWNDILTQLEHQLFAIAGRYITKLKHVPEENQILLEKISFSSSEQKYYENIVFPYLSDSPVPLTKERNQEIVKELEIKGVEVSNQMYQIIKEHDIDVIIAENTNAMPMTLLGGFAVYNLAIKRRLATIFHHHDFWWERSRFSQNHIESLLNHIMPPVDLGVEHVVLTSYAEHILRSIKRVQPFVIPNCEDFNNPPVLDDYNREFRSDFGFKDDDILFVQPTRIVRRKRIEDSLELINRLKNRYPDLNNKIHFIISLYQGDEPDNDYIKEIRQLAEEYEIPLHMISDHVYSERGTTKDGKRIYTNRDVLVNADMVTYLPIWEGFGNALLEAIAAKVPVIVTTYLVYKTDIKVTSIRNVEIRDRYNSKGKLIIPDDAIHRIYYLLNHPDERKKLIERNFNIAKNEYSFETLKNKIKKLLYHYSDEIRASRARMRKSKMNYSV
jgi:glycosyltransferase involved in cell wall biosynthesis